MLLVKRGRVSVETMQAFLEFFGLFTFSVLLMLNLFLRLQIETSSDLLLSKNCFCAFIVQSFSSKHKLHLFEPPEYGFACYRIDHVMVKFCYFFLEIPECVSKVPFR